MTKDREDLMAEAVALVRRLEWTDDRQTGPVVAGLRNGGELSIYFGEDPVVHFDADNRLRRAFLGGKQYRTQGDVLAELTRVRTESQTVLQRRDLSPAETEDCLAGIRSQVSGLCEALIRGELHTSRQVPETDAALEGDLRDRLRELAQSPLELAPAFPGKR